MNFLRKVIVLLNVKPFTSFFHAIYAFGVSRLVATLAKHRAIQAVAGYGSFFEGNCLYGVSDIDFVFVIGDNFSRADTVHHEIAFLYNRLRRILRFLAVWPESAENLIFLSDLRAGFPLSESLKLRIKQQRLVWLYGPPLLNEFATGPVSSGEVIAEIDTLLRIALMKGEAQTGKQLFWKKLFSKLIALADAASLQVLAAELRARKEMAFLHDNDISLYLRKSDADLLFSLLLTYAQEILGAMQQREQTLVLTCARIESHAGNGNGRISQEYHPECSHALTVLRQAENARVQTILSPLYGLTPRLRYVPLDTLLPVIEMEHGSYATLRRIARIIARDGKEYESFLVRAHDFLFLMHKLTSHVDILPLDPLLFANLYVRLAEQQGSFLMPASLYEEQKRIADRMFSAFADIYRKNSGWIEKLQFPCIYLEDDRVVIQDAFYRMRVFLAHTDSADIAETHVLVDFLSRKYPDCQTFLRDLLSYSQYLNGEHTHKLPANNLYRCLLQFMAQLLSGASCITVDDHRQRLGITVGIITRNRAADLQDVLASLTRQTRPADEILIVDNGSTDNTRPTIERFHGRLPISYYFLAEASIPKARNLVIDRAQHEIISFTDDDCIVETEWLDSVERGFLRAENIGIVGGWVKHEPSAEVSLLDTYYSIFHHNKS